MELRIAKLGSLSFKKTSKENPKGAAKPRPLWTPLGLFEGQRVVVEVGNFVNLADSPGVGGRVALWWS